MTVMQPHTREHEAKVIVLTARLTRHLSDELAELAARRERSVSGEVRLAIREHLARQGSGEAA